MTLYFEFKNYVYSENVLTEGFSADLVPEKLKPIFNLIDQFKDKLKIKFSEIIRLFLNSKVFAFFKKIGFDLEKLFKIIKTGYQTFLKFKQVIGDYIRNSKINKWTEENLRKLDDFLKSHPMIKRIGGVLLSAMLIYIWFNMSFTGDVDYDFDFSDVLDALSGTFSLETIFSGTNGLKLLLFLATGLIGLSFPWPGPGSVKFIIAVIKTLFTALKKKVQSVREIIKEEIQLCLAEKYFLSEATIGKMRKPTEEDIIRSIKNRNYVGIYYEEEEGSAVKSGFRLIEPYVFGKGFKHSVTNEISHDNDLYLRSYVVMNSNADSQTKGKFKTKRTSVSLSGDKPTWRMLKMERIKKWINLERKFKGNRPLYHANDKNINIIKAAV